MATGSELQLAVDARDVMQKDGVPTAVVSMPCRLLFEEQVAIEAAVELVWERNLGFDGKFVGTKGFGESGKIEDVNKKVDITTEAIVEVAREAIEANKN